MKVKIIGPHGGSDTATITPEPSPTPTTPRAKIVDPISSLVDQVPLAAGDLTLQTKRVWPLSAHEG